MTDQAKNRLLINAVFILFACASLLAADENANPTPSQLVAKAVQHEIAANTDSGSHFMFKNERRTARLSQVKWLVETRDATAGMLVEQDGHPLTPQQQAAEKARLQNYINNHDELERKRKQEKEDAERTEKIVRALPSAFIYEHDGTQKGTSAVGREGDDLIRLKFRPNPNYNPPSRVEQVLTAMQGHILVDNHENRLAEIDGTLQKDVGFGWGILGHLDRGGRFLVQQADVGDGNWEVTRMELSFTGKILLLKKLNIHSMDVFSDFRPVPRNLTFAQGVALLEKQVAQNSTPVNSLNNQPKPAQSQESKNQAHDSEKPLCCDQ